VDLRALDDALRQALSGAGQVVLLLGDPGIGKTRTAEHVAAGARERGALVLWGSCFAWEGAPAYWPWTQALRAWLGTVDDATLRAVTGLQAAHVAQIIPDMHDRLADLPTPPGMEPEARYQFEVNVFGVARLTQLVLPSMREQRSGTIVNITSMGGKIYTPLGAWYHATKFALEGLSDCLRMEVKPFGIDVVVIEPGGVRSEWGGIAAEKLRAVSSTGPYAPQGNAVAVSLSSDATQRRSSPPELIAKTIAKALTARRPKTRYAVGYGAKPMIFLHSILPNRWFDAFIRRATGVPS
jgi:NAD(P)-dependent dehydrogenase (short-subunit alcohol dehydrogenase family)